MDKKVVLKVNGQEIPLNPFVSDVIKNVVNGLVDSLDNIPAGKGKIEVLVENN